MYHTITSNLGSTKDCNHKKKFLYQNVKKQLKIEQLTFVSETPFTEINPPGVHFLITDFG